MSPFTDRLQVLIQAFQSSAGADAEKELRAMRQQVAKVCLQTGDADLPQVYAGDLGEAHRLVVGSGLARTRMTFKERKFARPIVETIRKSWPSQKHLKKLLAAMLYSEPHLLLENHDLGVVPAWFLTDYTDYFLQTLIQFRAVGDNEAYFRCLSGLVNSVHEFIRGRDFESYSAYANHFIPRLNLINAYFNENDLTALMRQRADMLERLLRGAREPVDFQFPPRPPARRKIIRLGLLIQLLTDHTETYFALAALSGIQRDIFDITIYSIARANNPMTEHAAALVDRVVYLDKLDKSGRVERIRRDDLDVLLISTNVTAVANDAFLTIPFRLARLQVATMASPVTTGFQNVDYFLSSVENEPEGHAQAYYTERLIQIDGALNHFAWQYDKRDATFEISAEALNIPAGAVVLFSNANCFKLLPEIIQAWVEVLSRVPDTILVLMPYNPNWSRDYDRGTLVQRLNHELDRRKVQRDRLFILDPVPTRADVLARMKIADIYLDSFPFSGSCSLFEPLELACPVVARAGSTTRSRHAAAILGMFGLDDLVAESRQEYIEIAVALAGDAGARRDVSERIEAVLKGGNPMLDVDSLGRRVAAAVQEIVAEYDQEQDDLYGSPAEALIEKCGALAGTIGADHPHASTLTDVKWIDLLVLPYFRMSTQDRVRRMLDVGACYGEAARPLVNAGWSVELFEPDPSCIDVLKRNFAGAPADSIRLHTIAIGPEDRKTVCFHKAQSDGLSGLSPSPYGPTKDVLSVTSRRLDAYLSEIGVDAVDFIKIDAEGWDLDVLMSHDFDNRPPALVMIEASTAFERQSLGAINQGLAWMREKGFGALVMQYRDDGNFEKGIWNYRLSGISLSDEISAGPDGFLANILFYPLGDTVFLANLARVLTHLRSLGEAPEASANAGPRRRI